MKRGIIVVHDGHKSFEAQQAFLSSQTDSVVSVKPMTSEDWYYQLEDATKDLSSGDEVHFQFLHYLGDSMTHIAHAVVGMADRGVRICVGESYLDENGMLDAIHCLIDAESQAAYARLTQLENLVKKRRSATPPKCILVSAELLEELHHVPSPLSD